MMKRIAATAILLLFVTAGPVLAQDPTPMPAAEYREGLVAFEQQAAAASEDLDGGVPTLATMVTLIETALHLFEAELARLQPITPEPCYADAHTVYIDYLSSSITVIREYGSAGTVWTHPRSWTSALPTPPRPTSSRAFRPSTRWRQEQPCTSTCGPSTP